MMGGHHAISGTAGWMALAGGAAITASDLGMKSFGPIGDSITLGAGVLGDLSTPEVLAGAVVATGADLAEARDRAYAAVALVELDGSHHRSDIALRASRGEVAVG